MKLNLLIVASALISILLFQSAFALPPIDKEWKERYIETVPPPPFKEDAVMQKCNVCHAGMVKKAPKNEYGEAVGKHINKAGIKGLQGNAAGLKKYIQDGLDKAEEEKNSEGKKFGDIMKKDGKLPGEK